MSHSARQPADGFHLLGLAELILQHAAVGDVFGNRLQYVCRFVGAAHGSSADADGDEAAILAFPFDFDSVQASSAAEFFAQARVLLAAREYVFFRIEQQHVLGRTVSQHRDQRRIYVQKSSFQTRAVDAVDRTLHERAVTSFGAAKGLLVSLDLNRAGQLARDEGQNLFVALAIANVLGVRLNHQCPESMTVDLERNPHPVEGTRSIARHFAAVLHGLQHFGRGQQGLARADEIVGQSAAQLFGRWRGILFVDEIRKTEQLGGGIVERDVEIPRVHQLIDNGVHSGEKLLQVVGAAALLGDAIERRTERFHPLAVGDVAVAGVEARHFSVQQERRTRQGNIEQSTIFFSAPGFKGDALASRDCVGHPACLRQAVRRHHEILQTLTDSLGGWVIEHAGEGIVGPEHAMAGIHDA